MKRSHRIALAALLALFLALSACERAAEKVTESDTPKAETNEESAVPEIPEALSRFADFQLVRPDIQHDFEVSSGVRMRKWFAEQGLSLTLTTDWVGRGETVPVGTKEILIGGTNRPESENDMYPVFWTEVKN